MGEYGKIIYEESRFSSMPCLIAGGYIPQTMDRIGSQKKGE